MFEHTSRYYNVGTATLVLPDGGEEMYKRRRFLPMSTGMPILVEVTITQGDRLDVMSARTLGDPEQFWRICDANDAMNPTDLTKEIGARLRVPVPQP